MKPRHQVSRDAMELIKRFEGFRRSAAKLPDGRWTIGYGHTKTAREGVEITEKDADALLIYDLIGISAAVNDWTYAPLTPNQFDALISFAFNIGLENFRRSSALHRVNEGAMLQAAYALEVWRKADFEGERIVVDALVRRRAAEKALFLTPIQGWVPAPSPVVQPRIDHEVGDAAPSRRPTSLIVPLDGDSAVAHAEEASFEAGQPSATEAATEALAVRLQELVPEESPPAAPVEQPPEPFPAAEPIAPLERPVETIVLPVGEPIDFSATQGGQLQAAEAAGDVMITTPFQDAPDQPALFSPNAVLVSGAPNAQPSEVGTMANADLTRRVLHKDEPDLNDDFPGFDDSRGVDVGLAPYGVLAVAGLVLFIGGIFWGVASQSTLVWAASLLGVVFVAAAIYYLLERLGQGSD